MHRKLSVLRRISNELVRENIVKRYRVDVELVLMASEPCSLIGGVRLKLLLFHVISGEKLKFAQFSFQDSFQPDVEPHKLVFNVSNSFQKMFQSRK